MIELYVAGKKFSGWKSATVTRALNAFAASFDLTVSGKTKDGVVDIPLSAPCKIMVDGILAITGYIDEITPSYSKDMHEISIKGRSKTADLVDCSAIFETGQIVSNMNTIVGMMLRPFGASYQLNAAGGNSAIDFQLQQGETVCAAIQRLCAANSLTYYDDPESKLIIAELKPTASVARLVHKTQDGNNNVLSGSGNYSRKDRFSEYIVKSQISGDDYTVGKDLSTEGKALDSAIKRYRPLVITAESSLDNAGCATRAGWERCRRQGKSASFDYTVQGWTNKGKLWTPGDFVDVDDDYISVKGKLIISSATFSISADGGSITNLHLTYAEAFMTNPPNVPIGWKEG